MRSVVKVLGAGFILLTAACGQGATDPGNVVPPVHTAPPSAVPYFTEPPPASQPTQGVPDSDRLLAPPQVDASALPEGYPRQLTSQSGGSVLALHAEEGGCLKIGATVGEQTDKQVVVLVKQIQGPKDQMCPMHIRDVVVPVTLNAPLGQRTVVLRQG